MKGNLCVVSPAVAAVGVFQAERVPVQAQAMVYVKWVPGKAAPKFAGGACLSAHSFNSARHKMHACTCEHQCFGMSSPDM